MGSHAGISALIRRGRKIRTLTLHNVRTQQEGSYVLARKRVFARNWICQHLDFGLFSLRTVRNKCLLFKLPSLWYFVTLTQADWHSMPTVFRCSSSIFLHESSSRMPRLELPLNPSCLIHWCPVWLTLNFFSRRFLKIKKSLLFRVYSKDTWT